MSSRLSGLYCDGASVCTGIAMPCSSIITWKNGHPKVSPYGTLSRRDHRGDPEALGRVLHHRLGGDLGDRVARHARGAVAVAERGVFSFRSWSFGSWYTPPELQWKNASTPAPFHQVRGAVGVGGEGPPEVVGLRHREVET